jgi:Kdo2-lipid IVA lauroyltransferase/acyltransferase
MKRIFLKLVLLYSLFYSNYYYYVKKHRNREYEENAKLFLRDGIDTKESLRIIKRLIELKGIRKMERYIIPLIDKQFIDEFTEIEGLDILDRALSSGRAVVLISAHIGNLSIGLRILRKLGYGAVFLKSGIPDKRRSKSKLRVHPPDYSIYIPHPPVSHSTKEKILETLRSGKIIYYMVDSARGRKRVEVSCFGRTFTFPTGMLHYARQANAAVLPFIQLYRRGNIKLIIKEPIDGQWKQGERDYDRAIKEFARILESYILAYPEEYYGDIRRLVS